MAFKRLSVIQFFCLCFQCANKKYVENLEMRNIFASNDNTNNNKYTITECSVEPGTNRS